MYNHVKYFIYSTPNACEYDNGVIHYIQTVVSMKHNCELLLGEWMCMNHRHYQKQSI